MLKKAILGMTMLVFAATSMPTQAYAHGANLGPQVETWLAKFNDSNTYYVVFDNGLIANGGRFTRQVTAYLDKGSVILWHCGLPARFNIKADTVLLLRGMPVQYLEEGRELIEGQYKTQCQTDKYPGSVRANL
ncbi:hypothetical protein A2765_01595 [Candidatus Kaiserbacteria bacterium RIFCSPHIGHO2_01_FULL_56_24]|uniref:DUF5666 domain-containing protein n=1 Tax=Candidatus Kaiserbacteria bacterium RIFCSPHIGHO2_01_FULL_56_24 TaxID=1798487 RepID=A0A1F6DHA5_9BACT|nr:MAG: hypothetical protein A2765_01595 [Candidatus Kaiserbacteria bacterium RIFCSPHIGHO2_01_FULL_56_24]